MPAVSRIGDKVRSPDGGQINNKKKRPPEVMTAVGEANDRNVYANGILIVVMGNKVQEHPNYDDEIDKSPLTDCSDNVLIAGKGVGRIGDKYDKNVIIAGSDNVFCN